MKKFFNKAKPVIITVGAILAFYGFWKAIEHNHYTSGDCGGEKGCGWAWCKYYDGSDFLHDFNF